MSRYGLGKAGGLALAPVLLLTATQLPNEAWSPFSKGFLSKGGQGWEWVR